MKNIIFILFITISFISCNTEEKIQTEHYQQIKGWNILSDVEELAQKTINAGADSLYEINHLQLSHHIMHFLREVEDPEKLQLVNTLTKQAHEKGIKEVLVWDHALYKLGYYPAKFRTGKDSTIHLDNPDFWAWLKDDYRKMLDKVPEIDGIVLTFIETGAHVEDQYSEKLKTEEEKLAALVDSVADVIVKERGLNLYIRTFAYTKEEYAPLLKCIDLIKNPDIIVMVKEVPHDFFLTHPVARLVEKIKRPVLIEFDCGHEYNGQSIIVNTFVEKITERWKYFVKQKNVIGYVARTDRYHTTSIINRSSEILLYALNRISQDTSIAVDTIYNEFIALKYGKKAIPHIKPVFKNGYNIITSTFYTLGLNTTYHSRLNYNYRSIYSRHVSAKWLDTPVFYLEHGINKKFDYWKDVVNTLAPARQKAENSLLHQEVPHVIDDKLVKQGDLMNEEYLKYIITEKDYGIKLAEKSLTQIEAAKSVLKPHDYEELYTTFERTVSCGKLRRGTAKAYYSYRIYAQNPKKVSDFVRKTFQEGIDEMMDMIVHIRAYPEDIPYGQFNLRNDTKNAATLINLMTIEGWDEFGGVVFE